MVRVRALGAPGSPAGRRTHTPEPDTRLGEVGRRRRQHQARQLADGRRGLEPRRQRGDARRQRRRARRVRQRGVREDGLGLYAGPHCRHASPVLACMEKTGYRGRGWQRRAAAQAPARWSHLRRRVGHRIAEPVELLPRVAGAARVRLRPQTLAP